VEDRKQHASRGCDEPQTGCEKERPAQEHPLSDTRQERVQACLAQILQRKGVPAFSHNVCKVMGLMGDDEPSVRLITNTILQDCSLTLAVLRRANSAQYNRSNTPICSVARAVTLIGVEALRSLVGTMLFLEKYRKSSVPLRKLLLLALLTANHTRELAKKLELQGVEEAYLCGMFCNLGEVLVAHHLPDQYNAILAEIERSRLSQEAACLKVLGFRYEDLSRAMTARWNFPEAIIRNMAEPEPALPRRTGPQDGVKAIVAFSRDLTDTLYRLETPDSRSAVGALMEKYAHTVHLSPRVLQEVMSSAITETREMFSSVGIPLNHLHLHRLSRTGPFADNKQTSPAMQNGSLAAGEPAPCSEADAKLDGPGEGLLSRLVEELKEAVTSGAKVQLNEIVMMVLEACHRGAGFDRVVFGLATPDRSMIRGRLGLGPNVDDLIDMLRIQAADPADPFATALSRKQDLFVDNTLPNAFQRSRPLQTLGVTCFALYPVVVDHLVVGCLYLDKLRTDDQPGHRTLETIGRLRDTLAETIARARTSPPSK
jgi:HD-like signal output (HDOD) protein